MTLSRAVRSTQRLFRAVLHLLLTGMLVSGVSSCSLRESRPNVVIIVIDTLRAEALGCYGSPVSSSPELDSLAAQGVRFEKVIAQCTWTRPSIGSMLTSHYPRTLGLYKEVGEVLPLNFDTLPELFQQAGYTTIGATANPVINAHYNFDQGFDQYIDADVVFDWMPVAEGQAVRGTGDHWLPRAWDVFEATEQAIEQNTDNPYFVFVNIMDVHEFFAEEIPLGPDYEELFPRIKSDYSRRYMQATRLASVEVTRFVESLAERPGWENTLFVITSDHGETLEDHPGLAEPTSHGWLVYKSQAWVPLILYSNGNQLPAGASVAQPVRLLDLMPTLLDYAGLEVPDELEGTNVLPLATGAAGAAALPTAFVVETRFRTANKTAVYAGKWCYVENPDGHGGTSPQELQRAQYVENGTQTDVSANNPSVAASLERFLREWEERYPTQQVTPPGAAPSAEHLERLRSLGYID